MDPLSYLEEMCALRRNALTGETLICEQGFPFEPLTPQALNTMVLRAAQHGVKLDVETIRQYADSTLVETFNPAEAWLSTLPEWDGEDRITPLANRIITSNPDWPDSFRTFMLQMVARWRGEKIGQRDLTIPILVGGFGLGKTTFTSLLLPPELRQYYAENVKLRTSAEVYELVTTTLLINIDEFYQESPMQDMLVQFLLSRSEPVFRQPFGTNTLPRTAWAACMGTTGNLHPMTDAAGAARLVCVEVERKIDLATPIDYAQLYAQITEELDEGAEIELDDAVRERRAIQNAPYQEADNLVKMLQTLYGSPRSGQRVPATSIDSIIDRLMREYPYWTPGEHVNQDVGFALQEAGFKRSRIHGRSLYRIVEKDPRKLNFVDNEEPTEDKADDEYANNPLARALLAGLGKK